MRANIIVDDELWKKFTIRVIEKEGYRKRNAVISQLIEEYLRRNH